MKRGGLRPSRVLKASSEASVNIFHLPDFKPKHEKTHEFGLEPAKLHICNTNQHRSRL